MDWIKLLNKIPRSNKIEVILGVKSKTFR